MSEKIIRVETTVLPPEKLVEIFGNLVLDQLPLELQFSRISLKDPAAYDVIQDHTLIRVTGFSHITSMDLTDEKKTALMLEPIADKFAKELISLNKAEALCLKDKMYCYEPMMPIGLDYAAATVTKGLYMRVIRQYVISSDELITRFDSIVSKIQTANVNSLQK